MLDPRNIHGERRVRLFLLVAWLSAVLCCCPQFLVWQTFEPYKGWHQCVSIWDIEKWNIDTKIATGNSSQSAIASSTTGYGTPGALFGKESGHFLSMERPYNVVHLVLVFWAPLVCIAISYLIVALWVARYSNSAVRRRAPLEQRAAQRCPQMAKQL